MRPETRQVQAFYDGVGWTKTEDGHFADAGAEDLRPVSSEYVHRCHERVASHFPSTGRFFLDCASGPVQYQEYREYSIGFAFRVCVDISMMALVEARKSLGAHGLYVLGDITCLPFRSGQFDAVAALHTIYHVPSNLQPQAFGELYQVAKSGAPVVVVYSLGPYSILNTVLMIPVRALRLVRTSPRRFRNLMEKIRTALRQHPGAGDDVQSDTGHFYPYDFAWVNREVAQRFSGDILCWRSIGVPTMRSIIHSALGGKFWLRILFNLENRFPHLFGRIGQYPLIVLHKPAADDSVRGISGLG